MQVGSPVNSGALVPTKCIMCGTVFPGGLPTGPASAGASSTCQLQQSMYSSSGCIGAPSSVGGGPGTVGPLSFASLGSGPVGVSAMTTPTQPNAAASFVYSNSASMNMIALHGGSTPPFNTAAANSNCSLLAAGGPASSFLAQQQPLTSVISPTAMFANIGAPPQVCIANNF